MPAESAVLRYSRGLPPDRHLAERLRFLVLTGQQKGECFSALGELIFIGREGCQIVLHDSNISRKHAELAWKHGHYVIRDLGSANGVVVNGQKTPEAELHAGDVILIGLTVLQVYLPGQRLPVAPPPTAHTPSTAAPISAIARKRTLAMLALFFVGTAAYLTGGSDTMHVRPPIIPIEEEISEGHPTPPFPTGTTS